MKAAPSICAFESYVVPARAATPTDAAELAWTATYVHPHTSTPSEVLTRAPLCFLRQRIERVEMDLEAEAEFHRLPGFAAWFSGLLFRRLPGVLSPGAIRSMARGLWKRRRFDEDFLKTAFCLAALVEVLRFRESSALARP